MMDLLEKDEIEWLIQDRILLKNEKVIAKDRKDSNLPYLKIGDGQHRYSELSYIANKSNYNKIMTNREWLESLTDNQLAAFLSYGLLAEGAQIKTLPFVINLDIVAGRYTHTELGLRDWLGRPQEFIIVEEK